MDQGEPEKIQRLNATAAAGAVEGVQPSKVQEDHELFEEATMIDLILLNFVAEDEQKESFVYFAVIYPNVLEVNFLFRRGVFAKGKLNLFLGSRLSYEGDLFTQVLVCSTIQPPSSVLIFQ